MHHQNQMNKPESERESRRALSQINCEATEKVTQMIRTVHALAKKNRPMSDFVWICQLDDTKGLNLGTTYRNSTQASTFLSCISQEAFQQLSDRVQKAKFVTISGDDSTDINCEEQSLWYTRIVNKGEVMVSYLGCSTLEKANAEGIVGGLADIVRSNLNLNFEDFAGKLIGITTDGASVMLGRKSGQYLSQCWPIYICRYVMWHHQATITVRWLSARLQYLHY